MLPPGHAAVGYLLYSLYSRARGHRVPDDFVVVVAVLVGTQFPDLVDKPLAHAWSILPYGRSLAHSGIVALLVVAVALWLARSYGRAPIAFAVGHVSHLAADAVGIVIEGEWGFLWYYLGWPLFAFPDPGSEEYGSFTEYLLARELTLLTGLELVLVALALALWLADGRPGLGDLKRRVAAAA